MTQVLDFLKKIDAYIMKRYNDAFFYEADFILKENEDGQTYGPEIDPGKTTLAYGCPDGTSLIVTFNDDGRPFIQESPESWLECRPMSVYVPADLDEAIKRLNQADFLCDKPYVSLRHQLAPGFNEPQWIFGTPEECHTVGVFSADVK